MYGNFIYCGDLLLIIEERVSNFAMGCQKCGPKVHRLTLSLQTGVDINILTFKGLFIVNITKVLTCSI